jgi:hypothetical protein
VADTFIASTAKSSAAGGSSQTLRADLNGVDTGFLRFDLSGLAGKTITSVALRVHTSSTESWAGSYGTFDIKQVGQNDWKEQWMSYSNTVAVSNAVLGSLVAPSATNTWYATDLNTAAVQSRTGGLISMAVVGRVSDVMIINSRESTAKPELVVTYK